MPGLFPRLDILQQGFDSQYLIGRPQSSLKTNGATPLQARPELYSAYSVVDDAKSRAKRLSDEAAKEFNAASQKAQATTGKIELYSSKYYAACTFGGLLACVGLD